MRAVGRSRLQFAAPSRAELYANCLCIYDASRPLSFVQIVVGTPILPRIEPLCSFCCTYYSNFRRVRGTRARRNIAGTDSLKNARIGLPLLLSPFVLIANASSDFTNLSIASRQQISYNEYDKLGIIGVRSWTLKKRKRFIIK